ncbi:hypothetical protein Leryth_016422 [Lithospermum erythrorhizon]|nr:hypothetical protein Leryth_016422 [Lithospermum erythrorhizon]
METTLSSLLCISLNILLSSLVISASQSQTQKCGSQTLTNQYTNCNDLPFLNAYLHYTYDPMKSSLSLAFTAPPSTPNGWVAWAINPTGRGMIGSQSLVAFKDSRGMFTVKTYNITSYVLKESNVWFDVKNATAEESNGVTRLFATIVLPEKGKTDLNIVWQVGGSVTNGVPDQHAFLPANLASKIAINLLKGSATVDSTTKNKNIHGILNAVSWGMLFPVGIIVARYLRTFPSADPAWFYLHVACQVSAYIIGVAGWGTGLKLGNESKGVTHTYHRNIGIALFCLATVQICALFLRPKKDHHYRLYWNIYHHVMGYLILILSIINVFKGLHILSPEKKWKSTYIGILGTLGSIAVLLELITRVVVHRRKSSKSSTLNAFDGYVNS